MLQVSAGAQLVVSGVLLLGLLDLMVTLTIGVVAAPGPLRLLTVSPGTEALGVLPLVLFPTFLVPIVLHAISLRSLTAARAVVKAHS